MLPKSKLVVLLNHVIISPRWAAGIPKKPQRKSTLSALDPTSPRGPAAVTQPRGLDGAG